MEAKHTPTPWAKDKFYTLRGSNGRPVCLWDSGIGLSNRSEETDANSKFIVQCVNSHDALVETLRALTVAVRRFADGEMSSEFRDRLFLSRYDGPEQATFSSMCEANEYAESVLAITGETQ